MNTPLFRPPAEADSLILQIDQGCPHNRCTFCGMYRDVPYRRRTMDELRELIDGATRRQPGARRVFLADGDVIRRSYDDLEAILLLLNDALPGLTRVNSYANGSSISAKSESELRKLRALKLHTLYMGLESGDEDILARCRKNETAAMMVAAGQKARASGLRMSVMVLLGLGGADRGRAHVRHTADALNKMQPRLLSALRVVPIEGTQLHAEMAAGGFEQLTEWAVVLELRELVARLDLRGTIFRANHASNVVPLEARFPHDKQRLLAGLDELLHGTALDKHTPGRYPLWL